MASLCPHKNGDGSTKAKQTWPCPLLPYKCPRAVAVANAVVVSLAVLLQQTDVFLMMQEHGQPEPSSCAGLVLPGLEGPNSVCFGNPHAESGPSSPRSACVAFPSSRDVPWGRAGVCCLQRRLAQALGHISISRGPLLSLCRDVPRRFPGDMGSMPPAVSGSGPCPMQDNGQRLCHPVTRISDPCSSPKSPASSSAGQAGLVLESWAEPGQGRGPNRPAAMRC